MAVAAGGRGGGGGGGEKLLASVGQRPGLLLNPTKHRMASKELASPKCH